MPLARRIGVPLALPFLVTFAGAQSRKLNDALPASPGGGVIAEARVSPDGAWVVCRATLDSGGAELFSARLDGSSGPVSLVPPDGYDVLGQFEFAPLGLVAFIDGEDLYVVPLDGSWAPVPILPPDPGRSILRFQLSSDGGRVLFSTYTPGPCCTRTRLFIAPADGTTVPVELAGPTEVGDFRFTADERHAVYRTENDFYRVPLDASSRPLKLNGPEFSFAHLPWLVSPVGDRVLYLAREPGKIPEELFSVPIDGSSPSVELSSVAINAGDVQSFQFDRASGRVVYRADPVVDDLENLYSVPADGSAAAVQLNAPVVRSGDVTNFLVSSDAGRVVYFADEDRNGVREFHSAGIDGSAPFRLTGPPPSDATWPDFELGDGGRRILYGAGGLLSVSIERADVVRLSDSLYLSFAVSPDTSSVAFLEWRDGAPHLRHAAVDGSTAPVTLGGPFPPPGSFLSGGIVHVDGRFVLLQSDLETRSLKELYGFSVARPGPRVKLNPPLPTAMVWSDVTSFRVSPDGRRAAFTVPTWDRDFDFDELYGVSLERGARPIRLHPRVAPGAYHFVEGYELSPDGSRVVFQLEMGDSEPDFQLYSVPTDGSLVATELSERSDVRVPFELSRDGQWVVFTFYDYDGANGRIHAVSIGGGPTIELSGAPVQGGTIDSFQLTAGGNRVVYSADQLVDEVHELFSVPRDGSSPPLKLSGPLVAGGDVSSAFQLGTDGAVVVYRADQDVDERFELYRAPTNGSSGPVKVSGALVAGGNVQPGFRLSRDGSRVVYAADQEIDGVVELYAVPLDGSSHPVRLSRALVPGTFQISPEGRRVVYLADALARDVFELFSIPIDASTGPVRLNGTLVPGGDVLRPASGPSFRISSDGRRVVYRADQERDDVAELFGAPIDGSSRSVRLNDVLMPGGRVLEEIQLTPDGRHVVYVADQEKDDVHELFAAAIDRPGSARRLNGPMVPGGDVRFAAYATSSRVPVFQVTPDGKGVLYLADQETDEVFELFLSSLRGLGWAKE